MNAVKLAMEGLRGILELEPRDVVVDGLPFREVLSVTQISGGVATNVIPARVECTLNFRYAPDRNPEEAEEFRAGIPLRRIGDPETDIGRAVVFLVGEDAGYLTGATIPLDGGQSRWG